MTAHSLFSKGDVVETVKPEQDIEFIPAGTRVTLIRFCSFSDVGFWYGYTTLYGVVRTILVTDSNLQVIKEKKTS